MNSRRNEHAELSWSNPVVAVPVTGRSYSCPHFPSRTSRTIVGTTERAMQTITPHLWYANEAKEAAAFYTSVFPNAKITNVTTLHEHAIGRFRYCVF